MRARLRVHVLAFKLLLNFFLFVDARVNNLVEHVDADEVCHFSIHYLPVKELES